MPPLILPESDLISGVVLILNVERSSDKGGFFFSLFFFFFFFFFLLLLLLLFFLFFFVFFNQTLLTFFLFLRTKICCGIHNKRLAEALQMSTHNICFVEK